MITTIERFMKRSHMVSIALILVFNFIIPGCAQKNLRYEDRISKMTDVQLIEYYHAIGERIKDIEMQHRIDKELNREHFEHDIVLDQAIDGKIYNLEQKRKPALQELRRRNIEP